MEPILSDYKTLDRNKYELFVAQASVYRQFLSKRNPGRIFSYKFQQNSQSSKQTASKCGLKNCCNESNSCHVGHCNLK